HEIAYTVKRTLDETCGILGLERQSMLSVLTSSDRAPAVRIEDPKSPLLAKDLGLLARAIAAIDIDDPKLGDYDTWCTLFRAMWAACGGDRAFYADHILPWLDGNPQNLEDDMEAKLASFRDSQLGAEFVYQWAWEFGFKEGLETFGAERASELFGGVPLPVLYTGGSPRAAYTDPGSSGAGTSVVVAANRLPQLQLGSDIEIASCVAQALRQDRGEVIFSEGHFWYYVGSHWRPIEDHELRCVVHRYDGVLVPGAGSSLVPVKLNKARVDSVLHEMTAKLARPNFFAEAPVGINCSSGFISFAADGTPNVEPHQPEHRCRHVLRGALLLPIT